MKYGLILLIIALSGCTQHPRKPEPVSVPGYTVEQRMSPAMRAVVMELVYMRIDPNTSTGKELDK